MMVSSGEHARLESCYPNVQLVNSTILPIIGKAGCTMTSPLCTIRAKQVDQAKCTLPSIIKSKALLVSPAEIVNQKTLGQAYAAAKKAHSRPMLIIH